MTLAETAFLLVATHFVLDFTLQGDTVAQQKNRHVKNPLAAAVPWPYWLFSHAITHGVGVWVVTRSLPCALAETTLHSLIDFGKCDKLYGIFADQAAHLICKAAYLAVLFAPCFGAG